MKLNKLLGWLIVVLVGYYFFTALSRNWEQVRQIDFAITTEAITATLLYALAVVVSGWLWGKVFRQVTGRHVSTVESIRAHTAAWVLKYIPGQIGAYVYKLRWGQSHWASKTSSTTAFIYEALFLTLASTIFVIPILLLTAGDTMGASLFIAYVVAVLAVLLLSRSKLYELIRLLIKKVTGKKIGDVYVFSIKQMLAYTGWFTISRVINAVGFVVLAASVLPVTADMYLPLGAAYILAGIIGIYAFFVPSGLGVREAVIVAFAAIYFTTEEAIVLSLLARLYATVADGLLGLLYIYLTKRNKPNNSMEAEAV